MKKSIFSSALILSLLFAATVSAQTEVSLGVKAGGRATRYQVSGMGLSSKFESGGHVGIFSKIELSDYFAIQPELSLLYSTSELKTKATGKRDKFKYWGLEIPVYAVGQLPVGNGKLFLGAGPYAGYGLSAKTGGTDQYKKHNGESKSAMSRFDYGAGAILGYEFANGLSVNAGCQLGLNDLLNAGKKNATMKSRALSLSVGYKF